MPYINIDLDTSGWSEDEVVDMLNHLHEHHNKHVMAWIKDINMDYVCPDCEYALRCQR